MPKKNGETAPAIESSSAPEGGCFSLDFWGGGCYGGNKKDEKAEEGYWSAFIKRFFSSCCLSR